MNAARHHILWFSGWHDRCFGNDVKFPTKPLPKWLLIPPAVAMLLLLGTLSMQGGAANAIRTQEPTAAPAATPRPETATEPRTQPKAPALPRTPDLWQVASALLGVLVLGAGGLMMLRRLRNGPAAPTQAGLVALRQSVRLPGRHTLHVVEFDERLVLVGETEKGLMLLDTGRLPDRAADEAEVARRGATVDMLADDTAEDGAVPKNLVIPRPVPAPVRALPKPPVAPKPTAPVTTPKTPARATLNDFRALLQQVGRA